MYATNDGQPAACVRIARCSPDAICDRVSMMLCACARIRVAHSGKRSHVHRCANAFINVNILMQRDIAIARHATHPSIQHMLKLSSRELRADTFHDEAITLVNVSQTMFELNA